MKAQSPNHSTARELQVGLLMLVKSSHLSSVVKVCGRQVQLLLQPLLGDAGQQPPMTTWGDATGLFHSIRFKLQLPGSPGTCIYVLGVSSTNTHFGKD